MPQTEEGFADADGEAEDFHSVQGDAAGSEPEAGSAAATAGATSAKLTTAAAGGDEASSQSAPSQEPAAAGGRSFSRACLMRLHVSICRRCWHLFRWFPHLFSTHRACLLHLQASPRTFLLAIFNSCKAILN